MARDPDAFFAKLEKLGEQKVRNQLASGRTYGGEDVRLANEWLRQKDQERFDVVTREQIEIARAAAASARDAANEARTANKIAKIAIAIAITSTIIALFSGG